MNSNLGGSEALLVDDRRAGLVMLLLGDPHGLEGWEGGQDGATDPSRVLSFWWSNDLDLRVVGGSGGDLFLHSFSKAGEQGGTSGQDDVGVKVLPDVDITPPMYSVIDGVRDVESFVTKAQPWLEEKLRPLNLSSPIVITWPSGNS